MSDPTIKQNTILNSVVYEGKLLSEWIQYFRIDFNAMEDEEVIPIFLAKSSEAYYLFSKIRPYYELLESRFKRKLESSKLNIIERISSDKTKRLPNQDIIDSTARLSVQIEAEELETAKFIMSTFDIILKEYDSLSYIISKKFH